MALYNLVSESTENTVVSEYEPLKRTSEAFQSEEALEKELIHRLSDQGYEYITLNSEADMVSNLRKQLEKLNDYSFTDAEWDLFFKSVIANPTEGILAKTKKIQESYIQVLKTDNGNKNIYLIRKDNIFKNNLQVINQFENEGAHKDRYDVTILVNGLPLVHIELKKRGVPIKEAFNQINRYQTESFKYGSALFEYIQIFIISNGTHTKYYSNTVRGDSSTTKREYHNTFEFTSYWADEQNNIIPDLIDFTKTFFAKNTLLSILTKYCVFTENEKLLVMRPYQIVATEKILNKILTSEYQKTYGTIEGGGYIFHATGSGKTLTSFKTAQLSTKYDFLDKVIFVVDRKDLDYQTVREYEKFQKDSVSSNRNTKVLTSQLESSDPKTKVIVTTIQKLSRFVSKNVNHPVFNKRVVFIFDECHRSQFGSMHLEITKKFKKYNLFGFTGTPIFNVNSTSGKNPALKTTEQAFGRQLHSYTIIDSIKDGNTLPFKIDYIKTISEKENIEDKEVNDIDRNRAYLAPDRISVITKYIINHFNQKTYRNDKTYKQKISVSNTREEMRDINGFNSMFAVSSINAAKLYYSEFKKQLALTGEDLKVAIIYSYVPNEELVDGILNDEELENADKLEKSDREFLDNAINDYNLMFNTNFSTNGDGFSSYYKDVSMRVKNKELDLLIVVDIFLTGFDAPMLNTLWVDKNLQMHGLIQAFSRTNRILNSIKTFGNIVCFRNLEAKVNDAIALFSDKKASGIVLLKTFDEYFNGYHDEKSDSDKPGYSLLIKDLKADFPLGKEIIGMEDEKKFISLFGSILRSMNILNVFDEFENHKLLTEREFQDYKSLYYDLWDKYKSKGPDQENIINDVVFEIEILKTVDVDIDYILRLVDKSKDSHTWDDEIRLSIKKAVESSGTLRSKKRLIEMFIKGIDDNTDVFNAWRNFLNEEKETELQEIINSYKLNEAATKQFISNALKTGVFKRTGVEVNNILPKMSRFDLLRERKKREILNVLEGFFNEFKAL